MNRHANLNKFLAGANLVCAPCNKKNYMYVNKNVSEFFKIKCNKVEIDKVLGQRQSQDIVV